MHEYVLGGNARTNSKTRTIGLCKINPSKQHTVKWYLKKNQKQKVITQVVNKLSIYRDAQKSV